MALTVITVIEAASKEIQKSFLGSQSYIQKTMNQGLKNLLVSIQDQDRENKKQLMELTNDDRYGVLFEQKIDINIADYSADNRAEQASNDKYFLLLFSEQKKQLAALFRNIADCVTDEDFSYAVSQIADVTERQYTLLKNRYDLLVL